MIVKSKMTAIADAIREKTGKTEPLNLDEMASGVSEVYEAGKQAEWSDFWDDFQQKGNRTDYGYGFCGGIVSYTQGWSDRNFKPKYDMKPTNTTRMFYSNGITDLKKILETQGVVLDTSKSKNAALMFGYATQITHIPALDFSSVAQKEGVTTLFSYCYNLETIDKVILPEKNEFVFTTFFNRCDSLKNVKFEGRICTSLSCSVSPLTAESLKSIISCLKDYSGTESEYAYTITFKATAFEVLESEGATAEYTDAEGNTTLITWGELIDNKKWNLVTA